MQVSVLGTDGKGIANASVSLRSNTAERKLLAGPSTTATDGSVTFTAEANSKVRVHIMAEKYLPYTCPAFINNAKTCISCSLRVELSHHVNEPNANFVVVNCSESPTKLWIRSSGTTSWRELALPEYSRCSLRLDGDAYDVCTRLLSGDGRLCLFRRASAVNLKRWASDAPSELMNFRAVARIVEAKRYVGGKWTNCRIPPDFHDCGWHFDAEQSIAYMALPQECLPVSSIAGGE